MNGHPTQRTRGRKRKKSFSNPQEDVAQNYKQQHRRVSSPSLVSSRASISSYGSLPSTLSSTSLPSSPLSAIQSARARPCFPQLYEKETFGWQHYRPLSTKPQAFLQEEMNLGNSRASSPPLSVQRCRGSSFSPALLLPEPQTQPGLQLFTTPPSPLQLFHLPLNSHNWLTYADWLFLSWTFHWRCELKRRKDQGGSLAMDWLYDAEYEAGDFIMDPRW
jgi:hypothetical protein